MIKCIASLLVFISFYSLRAQEKRFFVPLEIKQAYEAGTRSVNGAPGQSYWQNTADYDIDVTIDVPNKKLFGTTSITYFNNSPDELSTLVVRLYADVYKEGNKRASSINLADVSDGVEVTHLKVNDEEYDSDNQRQVSRSGTNMTIRLDTPIAAHSEVTLSMDWSQIIPVTNRRNGVSDSTTFFIGYWYPQMAVYDDVFGWDQLDYEFDAEMYNNLGNFNVNITLPVSFNVWATGELQNAADILPDNILERYNQAKTSTETITIVSEEDLVGYTNKSNTWHFVAQEVSDFAFALSDHYRWDATTLSLGNRSVFINSVFPGESRGNAYDDLTQLQQQSMKFMSESFPGVPYPYPVFTTYIGRGGGGMEYPMMANNGGPGRGVTVHEMLHTYFPMYVRINERKYAWMDEGWAQFNTAVLERYYFEDSKEPYYAGLHSAPGFMGSTSDLPMITSTQFTDNSNYGFHAYTIPAFIYGMIYDVLGNDVFLQCYRTYIERWAKKSPTPYDFFYTFEDVSGKDLSAIWKPWFFEYGSADIKVESMRKGSLTISNQGNKTVPLALNVQYQDGTEEMILAKADAWKANSMTVRIPNAAEVNIISVNLGVPDENPRDNFYPVLEVMMAENKLPEALLGDYMMSGAAAMFTVKIEGDMYALQVPNGLINFIPLNDHTLRTLDGSITLHFEIVDGTTTMDIEGAGRPLSGEKM